MDNDLLGYFVGTGFMVLWLALTIVLIVSLWKVFEKAGKPGWASLIPIYNVIVILEIVKKPLWMILLFFIPIANLLIGLYLTWELGKAFGKDSAFNLGLIFLPFIFYPILGFGNSQYQYQENTTAVPTPGMSQGE
jgi:ABC-type sulfate transport system permease subunit